MTIFYGTPNEQRQQQADAGIAALEKREANERFAEYTPPPPTEDKCDDCAANL